VNKSSKMVSLFLSTALLFGTTACAPQQQVVFDQEGNPITVEEDDDGFFGRFLAPFGFSKKHSSSAIRSVKQPGITSGGSTYPNSVNSGSSGSASSKSGISSGSSSTAGTGISSGTHGGIGGGGSSAS